MAILSSYLFRCLQNNRPPLAYVDTSLRNPTVGLDFSGNMEWCDIATQVGKPKVVLCLLLVVAQTHQVDGIDVPKYTELANVGPFQEETFCLVGSLSGPKHSNSVK